jgi:hypothetical protein
MSPQRNGKQVGHAAIRVRLVPNIKIQVDMAEQTVVMCLGDESPELGVSMTPEQARHLAGALLAHAAQVVEGPARIILPGQGDD